MLSSTQTTLEKILKHILYVCCGVWLTKPIKNLFKNNQKNELKSLLFDMAAVKIPKHTSVSSGKIVLKLLWA